MVTLRQRLEDKKNEIGLVGTTLKFSRPKEGKGISEHITHDWQEIDIKIREGLDLAPDEETRIYLEKVNAVDGVETVAIDLLYHGCGHRELPTETGLGCPHTVENHDLILDGVARALKEKNKQGLENYVANAFEDVLDNTNARRHTRHAGQVLFWNNEGLENKGKFPDFYDAFVRINLALWGKAEDATLLKRFYTNSEKAGKAVKEFKDYLKAQLGTTNITRTYEKKDLFYKLFDKRHWRELAYRFTLATADLLDEQPKMRMCFGVPQDGVNPFDKLMKLPEIQEELAHGRYKSGIGTSQHTDPLLQLDSLYRKISRAIPVRTSEYTADSGLPVAYFGTRDLGEDETVKISRLRLGLSGDRTISLRVRRHEIQTPASYKVHPQNFPKLKVALLDTSGSMGLSPSNDEVVGDKSFIPWGDNSKYHYALKGLYGIDNFLERQGISAYVQSEAITFSDSTRTSGRRQLRSDEERRALLRNPSGGTKLDTRILEAGANEKCFLVSVSDGDIVNWKNIKVDYKKSIEKADYCHIHLGPKNEFTKDLESWGVGVHYVTGNDDLSKLMIDTVSSYYRGGSFN